MLNQIKRWRGLISLCQWPPADALGTPTSVFSGCTWPFEAAEASKFDPILVTPHVVCRSLISLEMSHTALVSSCSAELPEGSEHQAALSLCIATPTHTSLYSLWTRKTIKLTFSFNSSFTISAHTNPGIKFSKQMEFCASHIPELVTFIPDTQHRILSTWLLLLLRINLPGVRWNHCSLLSWTSIFWTWLHSSLPGNGVTEGFFLLRKTGYVER